jgi:hypothetical protein
MCLYRSTIFSTYFMLDIYTYDDLEKMVGKIEKIRKVEYLEEIRDTIKKRNPELNITENSSGLWLNFGNLSQQTYVEIDNILKRISKSAKKSATTTTDSDRELKPNPPSTQATNSVDEYPYSNNSKLKYSNKERNIIKRGLYNKELEDNNPATGVFIKNT